LNAKKKRCLICKYTKPDLDQEVTTSSVYPTEGEPLKFYLCRTHAVELFRKGQKSFLASHYPMFKAYYGNEEDEDIIAFAKKQFDLSN
jgi:hypothetical protein